MEVKIDENEDIIIETIKHAIKKIEPKVNIVDANKGIKSTEHNHQEKEEKYEIILLVIGTVLFFIAMFLNISEKLKLI